MTVKNHFLFSIDARGYHHNWISKINPQPKDAPLRPQVGLSAASLALLYRDETKRYEDRKFELFSMLNYIQSLLPMLLNKRSRPPFRFDNGIDCVDKVPVARPIKWLPSHLHGCQFSNYVAAAHLLAVAVRRWASLITNYWSIIVNTVQIGQEASVDQSDASTTVSIIDWYLSRDFQRSVMPSRAAGTPAHTPISGYISTRKWLTWSPAFDQRSTDASETATSNTSRYFLPLFNSPFPK